MTVRLFPFEPLAEKDRDSHVTDAHSYHYGGPAQAAARGQTSAPPDLRAQKAEPPGYSFTQQLDERILELGREIEAIRRVKAAIPEYLPYDVAQNLAHIFYRASQPQRYDG